MRNARWNILEWAESGRLKPENVDAALAVSGVLPDAAAWRRFVSELFLWLGATLVAVGVIFFLAYNWQDLGRFSKFALVETLIIVAAATTWFYGLESTAGKAALLAATLVTGALMALFGQTYQTGADPWELFANWALVVLPWILVARLAALWLIWLALINLAVVLYQQAFHGLFGVLSGQASQLWSLFILNIAALVIWEWLALYGIHCLRPRWAARIVATVSGSCATILALVWVFERREIGPWALPAYLLWMGMAYWFYRFRNLDVYVLAAGVLSAVIVIPAFLAHHLLRHSDAGGFLLIGLLVIAMSASGAWWLKGVAVEERS